MKESVFIVEKMDCPSEEQLVRGRLQELPGVTNLDFNLLRRELTVTHDTSEAALLERLTPLGLGAALKSEGANREMPAAESAPAVSRQTWALLGLSGIAAIGAEVFAWVSGNEQSVWVLLLAAVSIGSGGLDTLKKGWVAIRTLTLNIHFLMGVAVIGAAAIGEWPEAAVVIFLFALAEVIESLSLGRARNAIHSLMQMAPETATVQMPGGEWREMEAALVIVGQVVRVRPGERIALDGTVTAGNSSVNRA